MIDYNPKDWFTFIFRIHQADTFRKLLPMIVAICLYSALVAWLESAVWKLPDDSRVKNISLLHSLLGFVISLLLAFRSNSAYDRWWEGRKQWGALVNNSRNLALRMNALLPEEDRDNREFFRAMIPNYAFALKNHLRDQFNPEEFVAGGGVEARHLDPSRHVPNQLASLLMRKVYALQKQGVLTGEQLLSMNAELQSFTDICGACERIRNTPIPFSYSVFLKKFIFFYVMTLPFGLAFSLGYYVILAVAFVFYVLASMELIAEEIENPFGTDANDLPTDGISGKIRRHVGEIL
ncbi:bestrophin family protein [Myxococcus sp. RHSTA-1-4]|uniref:bestrophin family protein n=1 Tax=Myxococcus sp. RHSTA-1-4 TaxID=2874601 RepID=UPI001CBC3DA4|nr:bestrophin family protein [Myxococcus sp. RHSTA-1-4]MBZ4416672.1 bestrophin family protein [Myxococcus sp. RHSTA-1-4]